MVKKKKTSSSNTTIVINGIKPDELKQIFIEALLESEEIKKKNAEEQCEQGFIKRRKEFGYKEYSNVKIPWRWVLQFCNSVMTFLKLSFRSKEQIKENLVTLSLLKVFLMFIFILIKWGLIFVCIGCFLYMPLQYLLSDWWSFFSPHPWYYNLLLAYYGIAAFMFSALFRIASIEIENTDDCNYLFGLFTAIASIVSVISASIAVITVIKGG